MKSVIEIEENWTTQSFKQSYEHSDDILRYNQLPNRSNPYATLKTQQQQLYSNLPEIPYHETYHLQSVKQNLDDIDKATAIANLSPEEWKAYELSGVLPGYLQVNPDLIDESRPADENVRNQIDKYVSVVPVRDVLNANQTTGSSPAPVGGGSSNDSSAGWFWHPRGDVLFSVGNSTVEIPAWPESVKDDTAATWSQEMTTYQHYQPVNTYKGSGPRTVSCSFKLHRAMWDGNQDNGSFEVVIALMESACYPDYNVQQASPPLCTLTIGTSINITGVMTAFGCVYQGPIGPGNAYDEGIITISITEVDDTVLSQQAVAGGLGGYR